MEQEYENGKSALHLAAEEGNVTLIQKLLTSNPNVNEIDDIGWTPLHYAASNNQVEAVDILIKNGAITDVCDDYGITPLLTTCYNGNFEIFEKIKTESTINKKDNNGLTPFHVAAAMGHVNIVDLLIKSGVEIDGETNDGLTALHLATQQGHIDVITMLLKNNSQINRCDIYNETALHVASRKGHCTVVELLLNNNASIDEVDSFGSAALHCATYYEHIDTVKVLLKNKANHKLKNNKGETALKIAVKLDYLEIAILLGEVGGNVRPTPLHYAARRNKMEFANLLLEKGENVNVVEDSDATLLLLAVTAGHFNMAKLLIEAGAQVNYFPHNYKSLMPLNVAIASSRCDIVKLLLINEADVNAKTEEGFTGLHLAVERNQIDCVRALLDFNANVNVKNDSNNHSALHVCALENTVEIANLLIQKGADVNAVDLNRATPLHLTTRNLHCDMIALLLNNRADINATDEKGCTALHFAVEKSHVNSIKTLLTFNPNVNAKDDNETSPLQIAVYLGHFDIIEILLRHGADACAKNKYNSVLHQAIKNVDILKLILKEIKSKLDGDTEQLVSVLNVCDHKGNTPLIWAAGGGKLEIIKMLLDLMEIDINKQNYSGNSALHSAARKGDICIVEALLIRNALPNAKNNNTNSPLQLSLMFDHFEVAKMLINHGADVLAKNDSKSVLHLSVYNDDVFKLTFDKILKQLNGDEKQLRGVLNMQDDEGDTPLTWAVSEKNAFATQAFLTCNQIDINHRNLIGKTALHISVNLGLFDITEMLIKHGADVFARNNHETVLHRSLRHADILQLVLTEIHKQCEGDADRLRSALNAPDTEGDTPLMYTAEIGKASSTKLLLECDGIDINEQNLDGWTALHWAAHKGHIDSLNLLIDKQADANIKNKNGETALDFVCHKISEDEKYEAITAALLNVTNKPSIIIRNLSNLDYYKWSGFLTFGLLTLYWIWKKFKY